MKNSAKKGIFHILNQRKKKAEIYFPKGTHNKWKNLYTLTAKEVPVYFEALVT